MERVAIDTTVAVYALGAASDYRDPCRALIRAAADDRLRLEATIGIVQELAHVRARRTGDRPEAVSQAGRLQAIVRCHPVDAEDMEQALLLFAAHPGLDMLDALHAATARNQGLSAIVTADRAFDDVPRLRRIDPMDAAELLDA